LESFVTAGDSYSNVNYEDTHLDLDRIQDVAKRVAAALGGQPPSSTEVVKWVHEPFVEKRLGGFIRKETMRRVQRRETVPTQGSRWLLDSRYWRERRPLQRQGDYGDEAYQYTYYLHWDGSLTAVKEMNYDGILDGRYFQGSSETSEGPMNESDILSFDFERLYYRQDGDFGVQSNVNNGGLVVRAKGDGLSQRLEQLLDNV
jgi:hypothetical protein